MERNQIAEKVKSIFTSVIASVAKPLNRKRSSGKISIRVVKDDENQLVLLRKCSIKIRLIVSFSLIILVMLTVLSLFSYNDSTSSMDKKVKSYSLQVMNQTTVVLENEITRMESYFTDISMSDTIQNSLSKQLDEDNFERLQISREVSQFMAKRFMIQDDIVNSSIWHGKDFSQVESYNTQIMEFDVDKIIRTSTNNINWTDFEVTINKKKETVFGMQKDVSSIKTGAVFGKMVIIPTYNYLAKAFEKLDIGKDSATNSPFPIFLIDSKGKIIASRSVDDYPIDVSNDNTKLISNEIINITKQNPKISASNVEIEINGKPSLVTYSKISSGNADWAIVSIIPYSYLNISANSLRNKSMGVGTICLIIAILLCVLIARSVSVPLDRLAITMKKAKDGDLTCHIQDKGNDEISAVCLNYNEMLSNISSLVSQVSITSQSVHSTSNKIATASVATLSASEQVALTVGQIAMGATDQASEINESVNNMDKLSEGITYVGGDVSQVTSIANKINSLNKNASKTICALNLKSNQVSETANKVSTNIIELSNSMKEIQKILKIMIGISEQTNLLSLNASIEATRAGEAGRGFAVVANEVKKLAAQSKEFTSNISSIINSISHKTNDTVEEVRKSNVVVSEQIVTVQDTEELFKTVFEAMEEVVKNIERTEKSVENIMKSKDKVMESMENISAVAEESAATAQEISASTQEQISSAEELSNYASLLGDLSVDLNREIAKFKTE